MTSPASPAARSAGDALHCRIADVASSNSYALTWMPLATAAIFNPALSCNGKHAYRRLARLRIGLPAWLTLRR
jgi:hypothetical protein